MVRYRNMKLQSIKDQAKLLRKEGSTYAEIGNILHISLFSARNMCSYEPRKRAKMGRKPKITKNIQMRIKRAITNIHQAGEKVNSRKIIKETGANVSIRTAQRHLLRMDLKYKRASPVIILSKLHKENEWLLLLSGLKTNTVGN